MDKLRKSKFYRSTCINDLNALLLLSDKVKTDKTLLNLFEVRCKDLSEIHSEFLKHHANVCSALMSDESVDLESEDVLRQSFLSDYYNVKAAYSKFFDHVTSPGMSNNSTMLTTTSHNISHVRLPKIELIKFKGDVKTFSCFLDQFDAVVHNNTILQPIEKFNYLIASLEGPPLSLVRTLPLTSDNYAIAYNSLVHRYSNRRLTAQAHWSEIENSSKVSNDNSSQIRKLLDTFSENISALNILGFPTKEWEFILTMMLLKRLDFSLVSRFEMEHGSTEIPKYEDLTKFLDKHCVVLDTMSASRYSKHSVHKQHTSSFVSTNDIKPGAPRICTFCKKDHSLYSCRVFQNKTVNERYNFCKGLRLCFNCLSNSHLLNACKSQSCCRKCNSNKHHTLLHSDRANKIVLSPHDSEGNKDGSGSSKGMNVGDEIPRLVGTSIASKSSPVLLSTAWLEVRDNQGNFQQLRCLLDSGSMSTFITQCAVSKLGISKSKCQIEIQGIGSVDSNVSTHSVTLALKPIGIKSPMLFTEAIVLNKICDNLPTFAFSTNNWSHIRNLKLADNHFNRPSQIDLLLGADIFPKLILPGSVSGNEDEPTALNTIFGFVLMGKMKENTSQFNSVSSFLCQSGVTITDLNSTFPGMRDYAMQRFLKLENRLLKQPDLYELYKNFMQEYVDMNHMEVVDNSYIPETSYYLVHHSVLKPSSTSTRLRVVFNASASITGQKSLNDCLMTGPKLQSDICCVLLNFRVFAYALCTDIKQMFRMIWLASHQRDYQRILWRFSPDEDIKDYNLKTVTYGLGPAPYLALRSLHELCKRYGDEFPLARKIIMEASYIDDFLFSSPSKAIALETRNQLIALMSRGGFQLRKWCSNDAYLLSDLPASHVALSPVSMNFDDTSTSFKVLGLQWHPANDYFYFDVKLTASTCTKRNLLSQLARVYDPLGFLSPVTFFTKYLIQKLWLSHVGWDDEPNNEIIRIWDQFASELPLLNHVKFPRLLLPTDFNACELHCFCDASERGYASVFYFRIFNFSGISVKLLCSKTKVAPLKKITIPRLELCSMVLLAKLYEFVTRTLEGKVKVEGIYAWSDSQIALHWINGSPQRWKTFVANRVSFIQSKLPASCWYYVETQCNPADLATRGLFPSKFISEDLWLEGPAFLRDSVLPLRSASSNFVVAAEEERKIVLMSTVTDSHALGRILDDCSDLIVAERVLCLIRRLFQSAKSPKSASKANVGNYSKEELHLALLTFCRYTQQIHFAREFENKCFSKCLRRLDAFVDTDHILRVGGRLKHAALKHNSKFPILLPPKCRLTTLLIRFYHNKYFHCGFRTTQFLISQTFWILSTRRAINSVLSKCTTCWKLKPKNFQPRMASLPSSRVLQAKPFLKVGLDFGGPFQITMTSHRGVKSRKAYLCLFVCFTTKAIHLELASDLSSESFLSALQRFISRRGRVSQIVCDNATNFVGASRELKLMKAASEKENISFVFSPPSGPHFNGLAEAGIKSVKTYLSKVIGSQILNYEEFYTVLTLIESLLNSRPLTPLSSDIEDINALTPGHFLTLEPLSPLPIPNFSELPLNRLSRWQLLQKLHCDFWRRWQSEYLHTLQQRGKWLKPGVTPQIGQLVLIKDENNPPCKWSLARITCLHPGDDGISRVATVKTASGLLKRPLVKLCPLPIA